MTNEKKNNLGLRRLLFMGVTGLCLIGLGEVISNIPSDSKIVEQVEYAAKVPGYLAFSLGAILGGASLAVVGGKKLYEISRELRDD